jgi:phosphopantetheinyl transferase
MGRSAAIELLKNYFPHEALQDLEIINSRDPDDFGKPMIYLKGQKHEGNLSITHSHHLSVAGYSQTHNLGLDLELQKQRTLGFKNKILTDKEKLKVQQLMQNRGESFGSEHFENELLTAYWTVKESIQKIKALGINLSPREIEVDFKVQNISELYQQKFIACFAKTAETFEVQLQLIELNNNERYTLCVAR